MKISEIMESEFSSNEEISTSEQFRRTFTNFDLNFDDCIKRHGTKGANVLFKSEIDKSKDELLIFIISTEPEFDAMIEARTKLEEKIKNSGGLSY